MEKEINKMSYETMIDYNKTEKFYEEGKMEKNNIENIQNKKYFEDINEVMQVYEELSKLKELHIIKSINPDFFFNFAETFVSSYKRILKENELAKQTLIKNCNIADERNQLLKENEQLRTEMNSLKEDMSSMYDEEIVIEIISNNFGLSREEVLDLIDY